MTKKELAKIKSDLKQLLTVEARTLYMSKDKDNQLRVSGIARAIEIIEKYSGPKL